VNYLQKENVSSIVRRIVGGLLSAKEKPLMQRTVKEYLWGYHDPLLKLLKSALPDIFTDDEVSAFYASVIFFYQINFNTQLKEYFVKRYSISYESYE
jgi:hypothetical protein